MSILIPCFNEARTIGTVLARVLAEPMPGARQLVVVDDGSTDESLSVIRSFAAAPLPASTTVTVLTHDRNRGKGAALRTALAQASGEIVIIQDADLEYDPRDYPALLEPIRNGSADAVYGSRWLTRHIGRTLPGHRRYVAGNWLVTRAANWLFGSRLTDQCTGFKVMAGSRARALDLRCQGFEVCSEITAKLRLDGCRIADVPIQYAPRTVAEGKKIRALDAARAIWILVRLRAGWPLPAADETLRPVAVAATRS